MRKDLDPHKAPCLRYAVEAAQKLNCEIVGAYAMGDTYNYLQFKAAGGEMVHTIELRPKNFRNGAKIVAQKLSTLEK